ncbi:DeoR/GlpR family DNA-binding transcription regulator [Halanaerobium sp. Z-7514]|uniref:DeoR/GlpR family DNA-binding transcription regulator n=1 Tax=Halanaerobium polyolivorans TaxID=2886943 RepID=A0AAW4X256_9FIRM|nr:DeoR/GlpR family DNA-binding transcription regulator [Halanaerobium polyolivorans]MCC3145914.1 DeoR/GlpR family DNA-binding transcription regulator [Halanaerobium polyolivorans]
MFAEERRKEIIKTLENSKRASVNELSEEFDVSRATIRRDLSELEKNGFLRRTHGGAILSASSKLEPSYKEKEDHFAKEKAAIGKKAADIIRDGDTIYIDAGTTTRNIIEHLNEKNNLTIVSNAHHIIKRIKDSEIDCELVVVGGNFKKTTEAMIGPMAEEFLQKLRVDKAFIGVNGFNLDAGATTPDPREAKMKEIAISIAAENFFLFDRSKWEELYFCRFADLDMIDFVITDQLSGEKEKALKEKNIQVIKA